MTAPTFSHNSGRACNDRAIFKSGKRRACEDSAALETGIARIDAHHSHTQCVFIPHKMYAIVICTASSIIEKCALMERGRRFMGMAASGAATYPRRRRVPYISGRILPPPADSFRRSRISNGPPAPNCKPFTFSRQSRAHCAPFLFLVSQEEELIGIRRW